MYNIFLAFNKIFKILLLNLRYDYDIYIMNINIVQGSGNNIVNISQVELLRNCIGRTRVKTSVALDGLVSFGETYHEYDLLLTGAQPSNPWVSDDPTFWTYNCPL